MRMLTFFAATFLSTIAFASDLRMEHELKLIERGVTLTRYMFDDGKVGRLTCNREIAQGVRGPVLSLYLGQEAFEIGGSAVRFMNKYESEQQCLIEKARLIDALRSSKTITVDLNGISF